MLHSLPQKQKSNFFLIISLKWDWHMRSYIIYCTISPLLAYCAGYLHWCVGFKGLENSRIRRKIYTSITSSSILATKLACASAFHLLKKRIVVADPNEEEVSNNKIELLNESATKVQQMRHRLRMIWMYLFYYDVAANIIAKPHNICNYKLNVKVHKIIGAWPNWSDL